MHESEGSKSIDPKTLWRGQPAGDFPMRSPGGFAMEGSRLHAMTRSDIVAAVAATLFFAAILIWRLGPNTIATVILLIALAWVVITIFWLRTRLRRSTVENFTAPGVEFYRVELEQRRQHLRNAWLWHGPLLVACVALAGLLIGTGRFAFTRLTQALPLIVALAIWTAVSMRRRWREADAIRRELDEIAGASRNAAQ